MNNLNEKLEQYEVTAVNVANDMHNPNLRSEASKEVITEFPNVRLASEKEKKEVKKGGAILPSLFLSAVIGLAGCCVGYNIRQTRDSKERVENAIDRLIDFDLRDNNGFTFTGDVDFFAETYSLRLLNAKPSEYIAKAVKVHFQKYIDPESPNTIKYVRDVK